MPDDTTKDKLVQTTSDTSQQDKEKKKNNMSKIDLKECVRKIELNGHTLESILNSNNPDILQNWDGWNFQIISTGEDDRAKFDVFLKNKNNKYQRVTIYNQEKNDA